MWFQAPSASLSPQRVFVDEVLVGCVTSAGTLWEPKSSVGDRSWGNGLWAGTLRWPGWTVGGTRMWNLEVWNQNVALNITTCINQCLYSHCGADSYCGAVSLRCSQLGTHKLSLFFFVSSWHRNEYQQAFEGLEREKVGQGLIFALCLDGWLGTWKTSVPLLGWCHVIVHPN